MIGELRQEGLVAQVPERLTSPQLHRLGEQIAALLESRGRQSPFVGAQPVELHPIESMATGIEGVARIGEHHIDTNRLQHSP